MLYFDDNTNALWRILVQEIDAYGAGSGQAERAWRGFATAAVKWADRNGAYAVTVPGALVVVGRSVPNAPVLVTRWDATGDTAAGMLDDFAAVLAAAMHGGELAAPGTRSLAFDVAAATLDGAADGQAL